MTLRIKGFTPDIIHRTNKTPVPTYHSKTKGDIAISSMHPQHLMNAFKKLFIPELMKTLAGAKTFSEVENVVYGIEEVAKQDATLFELYKELNRRGGN